MTITRLVSCAVIGIAVAHGEYLGAFVLFLVTLFHEIGEGEAEEQKKEGEK